MMLINRKSTLILRSVRHAFQRLLSFDTEHLEGKSAEEPRKDQDSIRSNVTCLGRVVLVSLRMTARAMDAVPEEANNKNVRREVFQALFCEVSYTSVC